MSGHDLYLVLRERLETVASDTFIGAEVLAQAQKDTGYSHERMGRELHISEKTWRRWLAKGRIPNESLEDVARVLRLEIVRPVTRVEVADEPTESDQIVALRGELAAVDEKVDEILRKVSA